MVEGGGDVWHGWKRIVCLNETLEPPPFFFGWRGGQETTNVWYGNDVETNFLYHGVLFWGVGD